MNVESKISIIIPLYNAENYIKKCIESALNQDIDKNFLSKNVGVFPWPFLCQFFKDL
jgi:cellulose synthase/poly-beta-1,6-N-acetylglucosamine synthase-like glycosyltransferase